MSGILRITKYLFEAMGELRSIRSTMEGIRAEQLALIELQRSAVPNTEPERLLKLKDVAALLKVDYRTAWNWKKSGLIKPVSVGAQEFYREADVVPLLGRG